MKSGRASGSRWICSSATMDCRKRCGCRSKSLCGAGRSRCASRRNTQMGALAFWEKWKSADGAELKGPLGAWIAQLKKGLAAIALAKSSQQFGREEEKE